MIRKILLGCFGLLILVFSGIEFYEHRHMAESVIVSDYVRKVKKLGEYFDKNSGYY